MATIELDKSDTWNPPKEWVFGQCQDCGKRFIPKLPKQYYCYGCRKFDPKPTAYSIRVAQYLASLPAKPKEIGMARSANPGRIRTAILAAGYNSYTQLEPLINISRSVLADWNAGTKPAKLSGPLKLAKALNTTLDKLFAPEVVNHLRSLYFDHLDANGESSLSLQDAERAFEKRKETQ